MLITKLNTGQHSWAIAPLLWPIPIRGACFALIFFQCASAQQEKNICPKSRDHISGQDCSMQKLCGEEILLIKERTGMVPLASSLEAEELTWGYLCPGLFFSLNQPRVLLRGRKLPLSPSLGRGDSQCCARANKPLRPGGTNRLIN